MKASAFIMFKTNMSGSVNYEQKILSYEKKVSRF